MRVFARCIDGNRCGVRGRILIPACENRVLPLPRTVSAFELCGDGRLRPSYLHRFSGREMRQVGISIGRSSCARRTAEGGCPHMSISSIDFDWLVYQALVGFIGARQFEGVRQYCLPFFHAGDDVGATKPVGLGEVGLRPPGGVVGSGRSRRCPRLARGLRAGSAPIPLGRCCSGYGRSRYGYCRSGRLRSRCGCHRRPCDRAGFHSIRGDRFLRRGGGGSRNRDD